MVSWVGSAVAEWEWMDSGINWTRQLLVLQSAWPNHWCFILVLLCNFVAAACTDNHVYVKPKAWWCKWNRSCVRRWPRSSARRKRESLTTSNLLCLSAACKSTSLKRHVSSCWCSIFFAFFCFCFFVPWVTKLWGVGGGGVEYWNHRFHLSFCLSSQALFRKYLLKHSAFCNQSWWEEQNMEMLFSGSRSQLELT